MTDEGRREILRAAENIETVPAYTARRLGFPLEAHGEGPPLDADGVILVNARHRALIVAAMRLFAALPPEERASRLSG